MQLFKMILYRLLWVFPVAFGVVTITFFMARVFNGDPTELYAPPEATEALRQQIREQLGLADPLPVQYVRYLFDLSRLDLGTSFSTGQSVGLELWIRLPATLELGLIGLTLGIVAGMPLGVLAAVNRERWPDFLIRGVTLSGMALPQFWIGLVLIWIFFVTLHWFPGPIGRLPIGVAPPPRLYRLLADRHAGGGQSRPVVAIRSTTRAARHNARLRGARADRAGHTGGDG